MSQYDDIVSRHSAARDARMARYEAATALLDAREPAFRERFEAEGRAIAAALNQGNVRTFGMGNVPHVGKGHGAPVWGWELVVDSRDGFELRWSLDTDGRWVSISYANVVSPQPLGLKRDEEWLGLLLAVIAKGRQDEVMLPTTIAGLYVLGTELVMHPAWFGGAVRARHFDGRRWRREQPGALEPVLAAAVRHLVIRQS